MRSCFSERRWRVAAAFVATMFAAMLPAGVITYPRDGGGRLTGVQYANGKAHSYTYDASGNLTRRAATLPVLGGDSDGDGLPDDWELLYFGNLGRDGNSDYDNDGFSDRSEYLSGTNPIDPESVLSITRTIPQPAQVTIEWRAIAGRTYRIQYKDTLNISTWSNLVGDVTAGGASATKTDSTIGGIPLRFYRVTLAP